MKSTKTSVCLTAVLALVTVGGLTGCENKDAKAESSSRSFAFSGKTLKIVSSETTLRIRSASGDQVQVEQTLRGDAADDGNAKISLDGGTLSVSVSCSGIVLTCEGEHVVSVPQGVNLHLEASGSPVDVSSFSGDLVARVKNDGSLKVSKPAGELDLTCNGGNITVTGATSRQVQAKTTADGNIKLSFTSAPQRVVASASGSVDVTVPGDESYQVVGATGGSLRSDANSKRIITVSAVDGAARVNQAD